MEWLFSSAALIQNCNNWYGKTYGLLFMLEKSVLIQNDLVIWPCTYDVWYGMRIVLVVGCICLPYPSCSELCVVCPMDGGVVGDYLGFFFWWFCGCCVSLHGYCNKASNVGASCIWMSEEWWDKVVKMSVVNVSLSGQLRYELEIVWMCWRSCGKYNRSKK
jgi:hypothetical protein